MIEGVGWKVSCKGTKSPVLSHWIIIALQASDILRDKFSTRVIIIHSGRSDKKKEKKKVLFQSNVASLFFFFLATQLNRVT